MRQARGSGGASRGGGRRPGRHDANRGGAMGPTQRQLRVGEALRHALADILFRNEIRDPDLDGVSVTITQVKPSPDMRYATVYCEPLGGGNADAVIQALNRHKGFLRGEMGRKRPRLILSFVRQDNSADEQAFIDEWSKVADKIHITDLHNWAGTLHGRSDVRYPCYRLWQTFTVLWDGRVSLCCADFDGRNVLGDMRIQLGNPGSRLAVLLKIEP